jgi:hypothetical protein
LLDYWGRYEQVFDTPPAGSVSSQELLQPEAEGVFMLLRFEHVGQIIDALRSHADELRITTVEQLDTLERWKSLSLANHRHMVAYIFSDGEGSGATTDDKRHAAAETKPSEGASGVERLEVRTRKLQFISLVLLGLFMIPLGLLVLIGELSKGSRLSPAFILVGLAPLATYGAVTWLFRRAYVKSVRYFSAEGLARNDGRDFAWADLSRVVNRTRLNRTTGITFIWRTEIQFRDGESAWILPTKIGNFTEVYELVRSLPCEHTEVRA